MSKNPFSLQGALVDYQDALTDNKNESLRSSLGSIDREDLERFISNWDRTLGSVYGSRLDKRLAWDGINDRETLKTILRNVQSKEAGQKQLQTLEDNRDILIKSVRSRSHSKEERQASADKEKRLRQQLGDISFIDVFVSLLATEETWLGDILAGYSNARFSQESVALSLVKDLARSLSQEASQVLYKEFNEQRPIDILIEAHKVGRQNKDSYPRKHYDMFCERVKREFGDILDNYPTLTWNLTVTLENWRVNARCLLDRLELDWNEIRQVFSLSEKAVIRSATFGSGDRHARGQSVCIIAISGEYSDQRLVYKPRDMAIDEAFNKCLSMTDAEHLPGSLKGFKVLNKVGYGYCEYIPHKPCLSKEDLQHFYLSFGRLAALLHCLGATDCHHENIMACGRDPVLIDVETLFEPIFSSSIVIDKSYPGSKLRERVDQSVMRTMIIPRWFYASKKYHAHEWTALGVFNSSNSTELTPGWLAPNTDGMMPGKVRISAQVPNSLPVDNQSENPLKDYTTDFIRGFRLQIESIMTNKSKWLSEAGGILSAFKGVPRRLVFRATSIYGQLLEDSRSPDQCCSFLRVGLIYEAMARAFIIENKRPSNWPLFHEECKQIFARDIPFFWSNCDGREIFNYEGDDICSDYIQQSGLACAEERIKALSAKDIDFQIELISGAFVSRFGAENSHLRNLQKDRLDPSYLPPQFLAKLDQLSQVYEPVRILRHLLLTAIPGDGALGWLGAVVGPDLKGLSFGILDDTFALGTSGIGYFFAICSRTYPEIEPFTSQLALMAAGNLLAFLNHANSERIRKWWIDSPAGLCGTAGAFVFFNALASLGFTPSEPKWGSFIELQNHLLDSIEPADLLSQPFDDVYSGLAGLVAPLINQGSAKAETLAIEIGEELMKRQQENGMWNNNGIHRSGFGHGSSGIAAALAYLYGRTNDERLKESCLIALNAEHETKSKDGLGWRDLRYPSNQAVYTQMWCQGTSGITLSRLVMIENGIKEQIVIDDLSTGILLLLNTVDNGIDDLCCGSAGVASTLRIIADWLDRNSSISLGWHSDDLRTKASLLSNDQVYEARRRGHYRTMIAHGTTELLSLMTGLAGIGMSLVDGSPASSGLRNVLTCGMLSPELDSINHSGIGRISKDRI